MRYRIYIAIMIASLASCNHEPVTKSTQKSSAWPTRSISVAAASDLKFAFEEITAEFNREHPEIEVKTTFGSSGTFYAQLSNKAPFDIFLSADMEYPRKLVAQGDAAPETEFQYGIGHLGIWVRNDSPLDMNQNGMAVLNDPAVRNVAIANSRFAPYGRAAEAALKHFEIYESIQDRLVLGENIAQTAMFVETGAADVGLIAASLVTASPLRDQGRFWLLPIDSYPTLQQGGVILSWAKDRQACEQFRSFVISESARTILQRYGFAQPEE